MNRSALLALGFALFISTKFPGIVAALLGLLGVGAALTGLDFYFSKDPYFDFSSGLRRYYVWRKNYIKGFFLTRKLQADTKDIRAMQERELLDILKYNSDTEYYRKWKLDQVENREDFVRLHPLVKYAHFAEEFDRMIDKSQEKVMVSEKPVYYGVTSGTTGKPSRIPIVPLSVTNVQNWRAVIVYNTQKEVPGMRALTRCMRLYYNVRRLLDRAKDGTPMGPVSACGKLFPHSDMYTTPPAGFEIPDETSTRYIHLLFGVRHRDLKKIETLFVSLVYFAFLDLEKESENLIKDVRNGTLKEGLDITPEQRAELLERLSPDPQRADELEQEFKKGYKNIAKRIWPQLEVIEAITSGNFAHYAQAMREQYTGDVLVFSWAYGASEGFLGQNLWPYRQPVNYLLWLYKIFYEFIPLAQVDQPNPQTVFADQLKKGEDYELVLTTPCGLYRYRLGDVVKIADFYNQAPVIEFLYRSGQLLNIKAEKVSELCLMESLKEAVDKATGGKVERVVDYTAFESNYAELAQLEGGESFNDSTPHYVILVECDFKGEMKDHSAMQDALTKALDAALLRNHSDYEWYRDKGAIDPLKVFLLKPGAFDELRSFMAQKAAAVQLKLPKVLRKPELLRLMWDQRLDRKEA